MEGVRGGLHPRPRVFPDYSEEAEEQVEGLEDRHGFHGRVEGFGEEVPEDLGPEEGVEGGGELV